MKKLFRLDHKLFFLIFLQILGWGGNTQAQVNYTQQTTYYTSGITSGGATFNSGGTQMGMWANNSGSKQVVAFREFRTDGNGGGSPATLGVGGTFTITVSAKRAYGKIGVALLASPTIGTSWADRESNYAITAELDGPAYTTGGSWGSWYAKYSGGTTSATSLTGDQDNYNDFTISFTKTSSNQMTVVINGQPLSNLTLNTTAAITHWSVFLQDDWTGGANADIFWKATTALPITLTKFTATSRNSRENALAWETASEYNNDRFEIERSGDARQWTTIGAVATQDGDSRSAQQYAFDDRQPLAGTNYYRLRQVDRDNSSTLSRMVKVAMNTHAPISVSPNPVRAGQSVTIAFPDAPEASTVRLYNAYGTLLRTWTISTDQATHELDLSGITPGLLVVECGAQTVKLIKE